MLQSGPSRRRVSAEAMATRGAGTQRAGPLGCSPGPGAGHRARPAAAAKCRELDIRRCRGGERRGRAGPTRLCTVAKRRTPHRRSSNVQQHDHHRTAHSQPQHTPAHDSDCSRAHGRGGRRVQTADAAAAGPAGPPPGAAKAGGAEPRRSRPCRRPDARCPAQAHDAGQSEDVLSLGGSEFRFLGCSGWLRTWRYLLLLLLRLRRDRAGILMGRKWDYCYLERSQERATGRASSARAAPRSVSGPSSLRAPIQRGPAPHRRPRAPRETVPALGAVRHARGPVPNTRSGAAGGPELSERDDDERRKARCTLDSLRG